MKRFFDITLAGLALIILMPVWFAVTLLILVVDPGPVLYLQTRVGKNGRHFLLYKFRTMYQISPDQETSTVTTQYDPRVFRGGHTIRRYKLDELPQLLNVLNGTMSLVGPRPTVYEDFERMDETQRRRFIVRPGMTGLAQISGNTALSWQRRIEYDLQYIGQQSTWLDLVILYRTVLLVITGRAETHPPGKNEWENG